MIYPILTTWEDIEAYEKQTGFKGLGERMIGAGLWKIQEEKCSKIVMAPSALSVAKHQRERAPESGTMT